VLTSVCQRCGAARSTGYVVAVWRGGNGPSWTRETNHMSSHIRDRLLGRAGRSGDMDHTCIQHRPHHGNHHQSVTPAEPRLASSSLIHLHPFRLVALVRLARTILPLPLPLLCYIVVVLTILDGTR
jgi:hypothetical protein